MAVASAVEKATGGWQQRAATHDWHAPTKARVMVQAAASGGSAIGASRATPASGEASGGATTGGDDEAHAANNASIAVPTSAAQRAVTRHR
jgi:hypothetical protein